MTLRTGDAWVDGWRSQVPGLQRSMNGRPLVYLDYASTAQLPRPVIEEVVRCFTELNANVGRGVYRIAADASRAFEDARCDVARFLGADSHEVVFTAGATDGLNLAASCIAGSLSHGDRILVSALDHHANLLPWQRAAQRSGAQVEAIPLRSDHHIDLDALEHSLAAGRARVLALPLVSNVLGTRLAVESVARLAHRHGALVVADVAQAVAHGPLEVEALGADVVAFSGHKVYGPRGIGVLWARSDLLDSWTPCRGGGGIVREVTLEHATYRDGPQRFEPGTPNLPGAVGLAAALRWLDAVGWAQVEAREQALLDDCAARLDGVAGLHRLCSDPHVPIFSFTLGSAHPHDVASMLDAEGIAVRAGRHCADPLHDHLERTASTRVSLSFLTTRAELDRLTEALERAGELLNP